MKLFPHRIYQSYIFQNIQSYAGKDSVQTMEKSATSKGKKNAPLNITVIKALIAGSAVFALCILLFPLILLRSTDPVTFVPAASAAAVALTALTSAFTVSRSGTHFFISTLICASIISALIFLSSLAFSGSSETDYVFSAVIYGAAVIFSFVGAALGKKRKVKKTSKRRR